MHVISIGCVCVCVYVYVHVVSGWAKGWKNEDTGTDDWQMSISSHGSLIHHQHCICSACTSYEYKVHDSCETHQAMGQNKYNQTYTFLDMFPQTYERHCKPTD